MSKLLNCTLSVEWESELQINEILCSEEREKLLYRKSKVRRNSNIIFKFCSSACWICNNWVVLSNEDQALYVLRWNLLAPPPPASYSNLGNAALGYIVMARTGVLPIAELDERWRGGSVSWTRMEAAQGGPYRLPWQKLFTTSLWQFQLLLHRKCIWTTIITEIIVGTGRPHHFSSGPMPSLCLFLIHRETKDQE